MDNHHYDCLGGKLSPETVPLCRRCHQTYHVWGIGAFSPDTTEKALAVENKRREILRSLPPDHPQYRRASYLGILSPLRLEDVRHARYWYKKWHVTPPRKEKVKTEAVSEMSLKMPNSPPLCGDDWLNKHLNDHTPEEIGSLTIQVSYDNRQLPVVSVADKRRTLTKMLRGSGLNAEVNAEGNSDS